MSNKLSIHAALQASSVKHGPIQDIGQSVDQRRTAPPCFPSTANAAVVPFLIVTVSARHASSTLALYPSMLDDRRGSYMSAVFVPEDLVIVTAANFTQPGSQLALSITNCQLWCTTNMQIQRAGISHDPHSSGHSVESSSQEHIP